MSFVAAGTGAFDYGFVFLIPGHELLKNVNPVSGPARIVTIVLRLPSFTSLY